MNASAPRIAPVVYPAVALVDGQVGGLSSLRYQPKHPNTSPPLTVPTFRAQIQESVLDTLCPSRLATPRHPWTLEDIVRLRNRETLRFLLLSVEEQQFGWSKIWHL